MKEDAFNVIVVGAGLAGSACALTLARPCSRARSWTICKFLRRVGWLCGLWNFRRFKRVMFGK